MLEKGHATEFKNPKTGKMGEENEICFLLRSSMIRRCVRKLDVVVRGFVLKTDSGMEARTFFRRIVSILLQLHRHGPLRRQAT